MALTKRILLAARPVEISGRPSLYFRLSITSAILRLPTRASAETHNSVGRVNIEPTPKNILEDLSISKLRIQFALANIFLMLINGYSPICLNSDWLRDGVSGISLGLFITISNASFEVVPNHLVIPPI